MKRGTFPWRKWLTTAHLWLGLGSSLIVVVLCATGTLLAMQGPVEEWVNRDVMRVEARGERMPLEELVPLAATAAPKPYDSVVVPAEPNQALIFRSGRAVTYVDPYTGETLGGIHQGVRDGFMVVFRLHRWLLLDQAVGRPITGVATIIFVVTVLTGVVLWWPRRLAQWARSLRINKAANWRGLNYDLHMVLGIYAAVPLVIMGVSAMNWSFRAPFHAVVHQVLDGAEKPATQPRPRAEGPAITALPYGRILEATSAVYSYQGPVRITFPKGDAPVEVAKIHAPTAISLPYTDRLRLDARTAEVVDREPFAEKTRAAQVLSLIKHIHMGTVYGGLSLVVYLIACAIGTTLPITGALHWWGKLSARRRAGRQRAEVEREPAGLPR